MSTPIEPLEPCDCTGGWPSMFSHSRWRYRLGMHLMFYGGTQVKFLHNHTVESVLRELSLRVRIVLEPPRSLDAQLGCSKAKSMIRRNPLNPSPHSSKPTPSPSTSSSSPILPSIGASMISSTGEYRRLMLSSACTFHYAAYVHTTGVNICVYLTSRSCMEALTT